MKNIVPPPIRALVGLFALALFTWPALTAAEDGCQMSVDGSVALLDFQKPDPSVPPELLEEVRFVAEISGCPQIWNPCSDWVGIEMELFDAVGTENAALTLHLPPESFTQTAGGCEIPDWQTALEAGAWLSLEVWSLASDGQAEVVQWVVNQGLKDLSVLLEEATEEPNKVRISSLGTYAVSGRKIREGGYPYGLPIKIPYAPSPKLTEGSALAEFPPLPVFQPVQKCVTLAGTRLCADYTSGTYRQTRSSDTSE